MKKINLLPNFITAFGLSCGLFVIFKVNMIEPGAGSYHVMMISALLLLLAAFADFVDGAVARIFKVESDFGLMFDSISDAISFGVAPSILLLKALSLEHGSILSFFAAAACMVYSLCGVLRLVRFNAKSIEAKGNIIDMTEQKKHFTGLPIPAAAAAAVSINLFFVSSFSDFLKFSELTISIILVSTMFVLGYLMVSRWKFPSLKGLHIKIPSFHLAFITVVLAIFLLFGIMYYFPIVLIFFSWAYIILAVVLSVIRIIAGKKSKTLQDFEPEDEDIEE